MMEGKLKYLTQQDLDYIFPRMREYDLKEITAQGWDREVCNVLPQLEHSYCYKVKGKPIAALGVYELDNVAHLWFFSTEQINNHWRTATAFARGFIAWVQREFFGKFIMVQVMETHRQSMVWLKRLGFVKTKHKFKKNGEELIMMEWRN